MNMLLREVTITDLADIFDRHRDRSPVPFLTDPVGVRRARKLARKNGLWDDITENLDPTRDIPVVKRSAFRNYQRVGDRTIPQARDAERQRELLRAAHAVWLDHPNADVDYLQDLLWAYCDSFTWVRAAHEDRSIDLGSGKLSTTFAEILNVLGDQLEDEVKERLSTEIDKRIFQNFWNYHQLDSWKTVRMNWNHVCNGAVIRTALFEIEDPKLLALMTHAAIQNLTYALDGFSDDGGCEEGPGYWSFGFGHYLYVAHALHQKTGGELNLMDDPKIERICRYPLAANISGKYRSTFADSGHGYIPSRVAVTINEFLDIPELYDLCPLHPDGTLQLSMEDHSLCHDFAIYNGKKAPGKQDNRDYLLEDLGQVKIRSKQGKDQITVMAIAGHNGVPHNHNDVGSFIVHRGNRLHLVDPGGPKYRKATFGPKRYEIPYCNSFGHSIPVINGRLQKEGHDYFGTLSTKNLNGEGDKKIVIDMTRAYPPGTVKDLLRTFTLGTNTNHLILQDAYTFSRTPRSIEESFVTFEKATVARDGKSVQIGPKSEGLRLQPLDLEGTFSIECLDEAAKTDGKNDEVITRISFTPKNLTKLMTLQFKIG
ncbi:MAG: heparinase II/III family protein [Candidatus Latescibacterota bacterium]|nr:heparinase II/III family protein [Candidatus Latescibacterota bacterium]